MILKLLPVLEPTTLNSNTDPQLWPAVSSVADKMWCLREGRWGRAFSVLSGLPRVTLPQSSSPERSQTNSAGGAPGAACGALICGHGM